MDDWEAEAQAIVQANRPGGRCSANEWLDTLDTATRKKVDALLDNDGLTATAITAVLQRRLDCPITPNTMQRHRARRCECGR